MSAEIARLTRERDEAREALADAGTLMDRTIAMSYCTSAEMPEKDHTHALPSAMLGVIRERDEARERAASLSRELLTAIRALDSYRASADLAASEKAREEADAYAGRANARIADLGERLDATEAVLRDAEKARKEAERERDAYRHEWNVSSRQHGAETRARYAAESRAARLEEKVRRIQSACGLPNPAEACRVILAIAAEEGK